MHVQNTSQKALPCAMGCLPPLIQARHQEEKRLSQEAGNFIDIRNLTVGDVPRADKAIGCGLPQTKPQMAVRVRRTALMATGCPVSPALAFLD